MACPQKHQKKRLYTLVLCQTTDNIKFREKIMDFFEQKTTEKKIILPNVEISLPAAYSINLPLIIKRYEFPDCFTNFIHKCEINQNFEIKGPYVNYFYK